MRTPKTQWKLCVRFDSHAYSVESHRGLDLTPEDLLSAVEDFAARVRRDIAAEQSQPERAR